MRCEGKVWCEIMKVCQSEPSQDVSDKKVVRLAKAAVELELKKNYILGAPVVVSDRKDRDIYELKEDGSRQKVGTRIRKGRYSERVRLRICSRGTNGGK